MWERKHNVQKITKNGTEDRTENMMIENKQENVKINFNAKENRTQKIEYVAKRQNIKQKGKWNVTGVKQ